MKTVVLFSGGIDSTTVLASAVASGDTCLALGFDYGQPHRIELECAEVLAAYYRVPFEIIRIPAMPKINDVIFAGRNFVFSSIGIATAQARKYNQIAVGCNASDWARFPDCRPEFWGNVERCAESYNIAVSAPFLYVNKTEVVRRAVEIDVPIGLTWSCYAPVGQTPCGTCLACEVRQEALRLQQPLK